MTTARLLIASVALSTGSALCGGLGAGGGMWVSERASDLSDAVALGGIALPSVVAGAGATLATVLAFAPIASSSAPPGVRVGGVLAALLGAAVAIASVGFALFIGGIGLLSMFAWH